MFGRNDGTQADASQAGAYGAPPPPPPTIPDPVPDGSLGEPTSPDPTVIAPSTPAAATPTPTITHLNVPAPSVDTTASTAPAPTGTPVVPDELLTIKQGALQDLSPLLGHLDQTPEEKFRTTMMLIQATDDHTKLKEAYDSAKQITDEKARAQALLDVVNEINYFTQQHGKKPAAV